MHQHSVESSHAEDRSRDGDDTAPSPDQPQLRRMVAVPGLAVPRRPAGAAGPPAIRRTLVDNSGQAPVNVTTEAQLRNYPWWATLTEPQQDYLLGRLDAEVGNFDLQQSLAAVPRRALTGGIDFVNRDSWPLVANLVDQYTDVVCADPAMNLKEAEKLKTSGELDFGSVKDLIQLVAPGARNADIFIIHPGPWIYKENTLHTDLRAVMTPGCVAYVLTDCEGGASSQADTLARGLDQLGGFTVDVQTVERGRDGMVDLAIGPQGGKINVKPYQPSSYKLVRIAA